MITDGLPITAAVTVCEDLGVCSPWHRRTRAQIQIDQIQMPEPSTIAETRPRCCPGNARGIGDLRFLGLGRPWHDLGRDIDQTCKLGIGSELTDQCRIRTPQRRRWTNESE